MWCVNQTLNENIHPADSCWYLPSVLPSHCQSHMEILMEFYLFKMQFDILSFYIVPFGKRAQTRYYLELLRTCLCLEKVFKYQNFYDVDWAKLSIWIFALFIGFSQYKCYLDIKTETVCFSVFVALVLLLWEMSFKCVLIFSLMCFHLPLAWEGWMADWVVKLIFSSFKYSNICLI